MANGWARAMSIFEQSAFEALVKQLLATTKKVDKGLHQLQARAFEIEKKYDPRREFERWRNSAEGKWWKRQQHRLQKGCCIDCQRSVQLKGAHIDHIQPIKHHPTLAIDLNNLQILCAECNSRKGSQRLTEDAINLE
jgi:5-methylcytosine-specific restriction endonuclease McrA